MNQFSVSKKIEKCAQDVQDIEQKVLVKMTRKKPLFP